ncbi:MAG: DUF4190 domain-containing protein [Clostridia bacterium]|nr:DUF4190 domain-containing protein [Clostridia bacterium]
MNNNPYDQNQQNASSENQQSFNNNPYAQYENNNYMPKESITSEPPKMNGLAIASMILGIVSLGCCCSSYVCGLLAIVFGIVARSCGNRSGKSMTGIICGAISLGLTTLMFIFYFVMGMLTASEATEMALLISRMIF